jgi:hypothetical protein
MACLIQLPRGGQLQQRGAMVNTPMRMETALSILPRTTSESQTLFVAIKGKLEYKSAVWQGMVRADRIRSCAAAT